MLHVGDASVVVAGGVEHMTRGPWVMSKTSKAFGRDMTLHDTSFGWRFINPKLQEVYGTEGKLRKTWWNCTAFLARTKTRLPTPVR